MGRRAVLVTELRGAHVVLRPFKPGEVEAVWRGLSRLDEIAHPRGPGDSGALPTDVFRRRLALSGRLWRGRLDLAIEARGRLIGQIQARTRPEQSLPIGVFEVGLALYSPADRGKGYGTESVALLTDWLFKDAAADRVQAGTGARNVAMRRVLERIGFTLEGVLRGYGALQDGSREDSAMYGRTRQDWELQVSTAQGRTRPGRRSSRPG